LPLQYQHYDCESKRESVTSLLERLITVNRVDALFAPYSSGLTLAGAPIAERYGAVYMNHGGASDVIFAQGFTCIVQTIGPGTRYHTGTLDMLHEMMPAARRLALVYEDSEFARMVKTGAERYARELGYEIVFDETYPTGPADLTPLLSAMKATKPDILLGGGHFQDGQLISRQMADLALEVKAISLIAAATLPAFHEALGDKAEGIMGPSQWEYGVQFSEATAREAGSPWFGPSQDEFVSLFQHVLGKDLMPDYHAAEAGAAVLALVLAIERAGTVEPEPVRHALGELQFISFYGGWDIDDRGLQVGHEMVDVQWQGGQRTIVWPPSARTGELVYPKPPFRP
jgi:branched-chain amino acid transport system substrate-binding protein